MGKHISLAVSTFLLSSLMIWAACVSTINVAKGSGNILYVPQDYPTIDAAIIAASQGDLIQVSQGSYSGFTIDKEVQVVGEVIFVTGIPIFPFVNGNVVITADKASLTGFRIDATGAAVTISGNNVNVSGNTMHAYSTSFNGGISVASGNNEVSNNVVAGTGLTGVSVGSRNRIAGNTIEGYSWSAMAGSGNEIVNNTFKSTMQIDGSDNLLLNNVVLGEVLLEGGGNNTVSKNAITNLSGIGIFAQGNSNNNEISDNLIVSGTGIKLGNPYARPSGNNKVLNNSIKSEGDGVLIDYGGVQEIRNNTIDSNANGVEISYQAGGGHEISANTVTAKGNCIFTHNSMYTGCRILNNILDSGEIGLYSTSQQYDSCVIAGNVIKNCSTGIKLDTGGWTVFSNNFVNNQEQAEDNGGNTWFNGTLGNYWSDWTSPDDNQDGIVDKPYVISGTGRGVDRYPQVSPVSFIPEFPSVLVWLLLAFATTIVTVCRVKRRQARESSQGTSENTTPNTLSSAVTAFVLSGCYSSRSPWAGY